jgi:hypothetical protein
MMALVVDGTGTVTRRVSAAAWSASTVGVPTIAQAEQLAVHLQPAAIIIAESAASERLPRSIERMAAVAPSAAIVVASVVASRCGQRAALQAGAMLYWDLCTQEDPALLLSACVRAARMREMMRLSSTRAAS